MNPWFDVANTLAKCFYFISCNPKAVLKISWIRVMTYDYRKAYNYFFNISIFILLLDISATNFIGGDRDTDDFLE